MWGKVSSPGQGACAGQALSPEGLPRREAFVEPALLPPGSALPCPALAAGRSLPFAVSFTSLQCGEPLAWLCGSGKEAQWALEVEGSALLGAGAAL